MTEQIIKTAKKVINTEIKGLETLSKKLDKNFAKAVNILKKTNALLEGHFVLSSGLCYSIV